MSALQSRRTTSPVRVGFASLLLLVYGAPLFYPPRPVEPGTFVRADAWLLERILPGVPPAWVAVRLAALAAASLLLCGARLRLVRPFGRASTSSRVAGVDARALALAIAFLQMAAIPWVSRLGPGGQTAYLAMLFVPAALLALPKWAGMRWRPRLGRHGRAIAGIVLSWIVLRFVTDLDSPRVADTIDLWQRFIDIVVFIQQKKNLLTDVWNPTASGAGGPALMFHGAPLFESGLLSLSFRSVQVFQIVWVAVCAVAVGRLARLLVGSAAAPVAVAVFLFAPYMRYVTLFPSPLLAGPIYATGIALCALSAVHRRSEAALAALGGLSGLAVTFPSVVPTVVLFLAWTAWHLRGSWRTRWAGVAAAVASFVAAVAPQWPNASMLGEPPVRFNAHGSIRIIDATLLGQLPLHGGPAAPAGGPPGPLDTIFGAVLAPFAHPRVGIRLWGDALFEPVGAALIAVGLAVCVRAALRSPQARVVLLFLFAALCPAFVSSVDVVDAVRAVALPVPAALLAAVGFAALQRHAGSKLAPARGAAVITALAIGVGGTVLFDAVNPRILSASSFGIMFEIVPSDLADRVVVFTYGPGFVAEPQTLATGPITAFGGARPVGYFEFDGSELPAADLVAKDKNLFFWSHGFDQDVEMVRAICRQWPVVAFFEISDRAGLGRVHAALVGGGPWWPMVSDARWQSWGCPKGGA